MPVKAAKKGKAYRVVEADTGKIAKKGKKAVDGGGHATKAAAQRQAQAINARTYGNKKRR